ncbi:hypothetical protein [Streptomyces sp. NPDC056291]
MITAIAITSTTTFREDSVPVRQPLTASSAMARTPMPPVVQGLRTTR